ncbi:hypothetical protein Tco_0119113, partial [Tanacetum coccineum]
AQIRRIFLDGYGVLDVRTLIFKRLRLSSRMRYLHGINDAIKEMLFDVITMQREINDELHATLTKSCKRRPDDQDPPPPPPKDSN